MGRATGTPNTELTGAALALDFRAGMEIAEEIGVFESWADESDQDVVQAVIAGSAPSEGLGARLLSREEHDRMEALVEQSRLINLQRFIGQEAVFKTDSRGAIQRFKWASSYVGREGRMVRSGAPKLKTVMSNITELLPAAGIIRIGDNNNPTLDRRYSDVRPFDNKTGQQVVQIRLTK